MSMSRPVGVPGEPVRSYARTMLAWIDTVLLREHLEPKGIRPEVGECNWLQNVAIGPEPESLAALHTLIDRYGAENVTTGNAAPCQPGQIGLYVRRDAIAMERAA